MNKTFFFVILTISFISFPRKAEANKVFSNYTDSLKVVGVIIHSPRYSKRIAILMRDTTLSGNRFNYQWHKGLDPNGRLSPIYYSLPSFLIDSTLATSCDSLLKFDPNNRQINWTSYPKKNLSRLTKKNIRLYIGYIDDVGNRNVVVQFISLRDFKRSKHIYSEELFLVVPRKELHFAVINVGH